MLGQLFQNANDQVRNELNNTVIYNHDDFKNYTSQYAEDLMYGFNFDSTDNTDYFALGGMNRMTSFIVYADGKIYYRIQITSIYGDTGEKEDDDLKNFAQSPLVKITSSYVEFDKDDEPVTDSSTKSMQEILKHDDDLDVLVQYKFNLGDVKDIVNSGKTKDHGPLLFTFKDGSKLELNSDFYHESRFRKKPVFDTDQVATVLNKVSEIVKQANNATTFR